MEEFEGTRIEVGMLFTDGFSNVAQSGYDNVDGNMGVPFADDHSNTLADIATKYYLNAADGGFAPLRSIQVYAFWFVAGLCAA